MLFFNELEVTVDTKKLKKSSTRKAQTLEVLA